MNRLIIILAAVVLCVGCADRHHCESVAACPDQAVALASAEPSAARLPSSLIFDRYPGMYSADQFNWRSDWPSTLGYYRAPEVLFYRERVYDRQGPGRGWNDYTYRRFDSVRLGKAVR